MHRISLLAISAAAPALAQPTLPLTQVMSAANPSPGSPAIRSTPSVDVAPDGSVVVCESQIFPRNVYRSAPGVPFRRLTQFPFLADMPDGSRFNVSFSGGWAGPQAAVYGTDGEIGLVGAAADQTIVPYFWARQQIPVLPAGIRFVWGRFPRVNIDNTGRAVARAVLEGPGVNSNNAFVLVESTPQGPRILFRSGSDPLNRPGVTFRNDLFSHEFAANDHGAAVFSASHLRNGGVAGPAVLVADANSVRVVADQDTVIPGYSNSTRITAVSYSLGINANADVAFVARVLPPGDPPGDAIFCTVNGELRTLFRSGQSIPTLGPGITASLGFDILSAITPINDFGDVAFTVQLSGAGVTSSNDKALCMARSGEIHVVAREGSPLPGSPGASIGEFSTFDSALFMNAKRQTIFALAGVNRAWLSWSPSRSLQSIAALRQPVPFDGVPTIITSLPATTLEQNGNYWIRATGGGDGRKTLLSDTGVVTVWATSGLGTAGLFQTTLPSECLADFNNDGFVDLFDYTGFTQAFEDGTPTADANNDGFLDFFDYGRFVEVYEGGCD